MHDKYLTVTALTKYLKYKIDSDGNLKNVFIKGEISNFKSHTTGHFYFSIKDESSKINAIMFKTNASKLNFIPTEGMKVMIVGSISIYEAMGSYQIYVEELIEDGIGNLYIAFEKLKEKLTKEGLFDLDHKKVIPRYPNKIGIITASTGAAIKDIISTIKRRYKIGEIILFPCLVQGENAPKDIVKKILLADSYNLDILIVGRGGGSFEDLNAFNDEEVARTIFNTNTPIISAVGHEIDYTIADFVSDLRAPTPTGAAELAVPNLIDIRNLINQYKIRLNEFVLKKINYNILYMETFKNSFVIKNPMLMYENKKQKIDLINEKIMNIIKNNMEKNKGKLNNLKNNYILLNPTQLYKNDRQNLINLIEKLELLNPLGILKRGYTLTIKNDLIINSVKKLKEKDEIKIKFQDGEILAKIIGGKNGEKN